MYTVIFIKLMSKTDPKGGRNKYRWVQVTTHEQQILIQETIQTMT